MEKQVFHEFKKQYYALRNKNNPLFHHKKLPSDYEFFIFYNEIYLDFLFLVAKNLFDVSSFRIDSQIPEQKALTLEDLEFFKEKNSPFEKNKKEIRLFFKIWLFLGVPPENFFFLNPLLDVEKEVKVCITTLNDISVEESNDLLGANINYFLLIMNLKREIILEYILLRNNLVHFFKEQKKLRNFEFLILEAIYGFDYHIFRACHSLDSLCNNLNKSYSFFKNQQKK
jgi:hypothetical protein